MYNITETPTHISITGLTNFDIDKIFDCGQCFRFDKVKSGIGGVAYGKYLYFEQPSKDELDIYGITKDEFSSVFARFLDIDTDYDAIGTAISEATHNDATMTSAIKTGYGIRILHQDGWETLCSFIISQNNNIPRIKKIIKTLSEKYGEPLGNGNFAFPSPQRLVEAGVEEIFELKTGFRAKYIYDAAKKVASGEIDLDLIKDMTTSEATEYLMKIKGVGLKVASCTLLFGFGKTDAFPIDVWVKRILAKYYPSGLDIAALGQNAGLSQQYLFYYERYTGGTK